MATGCACFLLGSYLSYQRGSDDGFDQGYSFATSDIEVAWRLTTKGEAALDADRVPVALSIHPSFSNSQLSTLNPQL